MGFPKFHHNNWRTRLAMRRLVLSSLFVAVALVFLYEANHAHAREPTRCGFWSSMEAGMSCR
jgi:hypothetical protein